MNSDSHCCHRILRVAASPNPTFKRDGAKARRPLAPRVRRAWRVMDVTIIAECVEDRPTADMLRDMGVDWGQGYYFGRPEI